MEKIPQVPVYYGFEYGGPATKAFKAESLKKLRKSLGITTKGTPYK
jgi:hypothetical protein